MFGFKPKIVQEAPQPVRSMRDMNEVQLFQKIGVESQLNGLESLRLAIDQMNAKYKDTKVRSNNHVETIICYINDLQKIHDQLTQMAGKLDDLFENVSYDLKLLKNIHGYYAEKKVPLQDSPVLERQDGRKEM